MDTSKKLRGMLERLEEITKCAVCLESVGTKVVQCMNGHGICSRCRKQILMCPSCGEFFLVNKPTMLVQVLETLPKLCQFNEQGCKDISFTGMHELFCEYRPIKCNIGKAWECKWDGMVKDFKSHVHGYHNSFLSSYKAGVPKNLYHKNFKDNWHTQYYLHVIDNNMFQIYVHKDHINKRFIQLVSHIPVGEPTGTYYFVVTFSKQKLIFKHSIKASVMLNDKERLDKSPYCMIVPLNELDNFLNPATGSLEVTFEVVKQ